jgi:hypothetical protein
VHFEHSAQARTANNHGFRGFDFAGHAAEVKRQAEEFRRAEAARELRRR